MQYSKNLVESFFSSLWGWWNCPNWYRLWNMSCLLRLSTPLKSNFKALFSSRNRLRALSDAILLLVGHCHVGHKNAYRLHAHGSACTLVAGMQEVALGIVFRLPAKVRNLWIFQTFQSDSGAHLTSYSMGIEGTSPGVKSSRREPDHSHHPVPRCRCTSSPPRELLRRLQGQLYFTRLSLKWFTMLYSTAARINITYKLQLPHACSPLDDLRSNQLFSLHFTRSI